MGVWDTETMCCAHTVSRLMRPIECVAFSHDGRVLASCSEEESVDLSDATTGKLVGLASVWQGSRNGGLSEVAWHPREHVLACARTDKGITKAPPLPLCILKLTIQAD